VKIITLHQPYASLIALGLKEFETRHWGVDYRGPLLIHAAKKPIPKQLDIPLIHLVKAQDSRSFQLQTALEQIRQNPNYGCIVAIADMTDCSRMIPDSPSYKQAEFFEIRVGSVSNLERVVGLWQPGRYALRLDSVRKLEPIPFKSRQGMLLDAPPEIISLVNQQLEKAA
jgi:hypothetical protein